MLGKLDLKAVEEKWARKWLEEKIYSFDEKNSGKPVYSIDSPPPFTSGTLHLGHVLSYAYFDFAARFKRMLGYNVFYPQGWDCQGFPTEIKVEKLYGYGKLSREEFKQKCIEFTLGNIKKMKAQMTQLGFSPDWRFEYKTIDKEYYRKVQLSLLKMFDKGMLYRTKHPVLFCTSCKSAIAKAETEELERESLLNYLVFKSSKGDLLIATTRPELLHACIAVFVHPEDERYKHLIGGTAVVPLFEKQVPIIAEPDVDRDFGTGIVMVCTFGDKSDVVWTYRHKLVPVEAVGEDGKLLNAGEFTGLNVAKAREKILEELKEKGLVKKQEKLVQVIKIHDRCGKPVEFISCMQWFIKVKEWKERIVEAAKIMHWIPQFSIQYLIDWAENLEWDWVISRQNIYGTPIPFWHCEKCNKIFAPKTSSLPVDPSKDSFHLKQCPDCNGELVGETSVCDCWIDSSITPLVISGWPEEKEFFNKVYPSSLRPQGLEIIRTWAFYTIFRCLVFTGKPCFNELLIHGNVLGTDGKKMSKSKGNYEDLDVLLTKYSADALRQWAALSGALAKDRPFSYKDVEFGQAFVTKLWNASKFVEKAIHSFDAGKHEAPSLRAVDKWMLSKLARLVKGVTQAMKNYDYYSAITAIHSFLWHDFCDYYLEDVKYRVYQKEGESKRAAQFVLHKVLSNTLKLLAPFIPFTTEEIHRSLFNEKSIHSLPWPASEEEYINEDAENISSVLHEILSQVRKFKASSALPLNESISFAELSVPEEILKELPLIEEEIKQVGKIASLSAKQGEKETRIELRV